MPPVKKSKKTLKIKKPLTKKVEKKSDKYIEAVGRRKTAVVRVRLFESVPSNLSGIDLKIKLGDIVVNGKNIKEYFPTIELGKIVSGPFLKENSSEKYFISAKIKGGGIHAQAEALRHGISRALVKENEDNRKYLKKLGFLSRDSRMKERRKFGLKKARKAPQWSKR